MAMSRNVDRIIRTLGPSQRKKVEARAAELIAEQMTLRELRRTRKLTQVTVAKALGITQDSVSRLEKVLGGNLSPVVEFPDRAPVVLSGIAEARAEGKPARRKRVRA